MARTPLLSRFQQLFRDFDEAERTGRSVADVRSSRLSRRDFLKAGAATAGAFAMSGPLGRLAAAASPPRIAIVGPSGMTRRTRRCSARARVRTITGTRIAAT